MADLRLEPFPHFVADDVLAMEDLAALNAVWPKRDAFTPEVKGNYVHWFNGAGSYLSRLVARQISTLIVSRLAGWIGARGLPERIDCFSALMESDTDYAGHVVHTHHYHSPHWLATGLLYLEPDTENLRGTTLHEVRTPIGADPLEHQATVAANTMSWLSHPDVAEVETVEFRPNRLFAFYEAVNSYHSVKPALPGARGSRRIFRVHLAAPVESCQTRYGVSRQEYAAMRPSGPPKDQRVHEWIRKDLAAVPIDGERLAAVTLNIV